VEDDEEDPEVATADAAEVEEDVTAGVAWEVVALLVVATANTGSCAATAGATAPGPVAGPDRAAELTLVELPA